MEITECPTQSARDNVRVWPGRRKSQSLITREPTRQATDREDEQDNLTRRDVLIEALEGAAAGAILDTERAVAFVKDPEGLADYLMDAMDKEFRKRRDAVIDTLADGLLLQWPIVSQGEPVPVTHEEMVGLPYFYLASMYKAIMDDMTPGKNSSRGRDRATRRR